MARRIKLCETNRFPGEKKCEIFRKLGCILCTADKVLRNKSFLRRKEGRDFQKTRRYVMAQPIKLCEKNGCEWAK